MTLHLVFTSQVSILSQLEQALSADDSLIFLGDGVYLLHQLNHHWRRQNPCYYRTTDIRQRGLPDSLPGNLRATPVDDSQWVELCLNHSCTLSWKL